MYDNVIVTDYDGVCGYWEHGFHMWMIENGFEHKANGSYNVEDKYGITKQQADNLVESFNESAALKRLPPVKDAIKYIKKLHEEHGYVFHCITAIPDTRDMYEARKENIENLFGKTAFERLTLCGSSENKKDLLAEYRNTDCLWIEDLPENCEMGLEYGMRCVLFDRHYNRDKLYPSLNRVYNWKDIYNILV